MYAESASKAEPSNIEALEVLAEVHIATNQYVVSDTCLINPQLKRTTQIRTNPSNRPTENTQQDTNKSYIVKIRPNYYY